MTDYKVNYAELRSGADAFDTMESTAANQLSTMNGVNLGQPDFGRIPWLQTRVYEAYVEHTRECAEALTDLRDALGAARDGLDGCADAYQSVDDAAAEAIGEFFAAVCS